MIITLSLRYVKEYWNNTCRATIPSHWEGITEAITFEGNTELCGEVYPISGNTREEVINQVISELKARGLHGTLKVR